LFFFRSNKSKTTGYEYFSGFIKGNPLYYNLLIPPDITNFSIFEWLPGFEYMIFLLPYDGRDPKLSEPGSTKSVSPNRS